MAAQSFDAPHRQQYFVVIHWMRVRRKLCDDDLALPVNEQVLPKYSHRKHDRLGHRPVRTTGCDSALAVVGSIWRNRPGPMLLGRPVSKCLQSSLMARFACRNMLHLPPIKDRVVRDRVLLRKSRQRSVAHLVDLP